MVNAALGELSAFAKLYSPIGRPSIAPEKQLRAILLQMLYTVRSERLLMEQLRYNMLFRWFVGLSIEEPVWDVTVFTKNRERFLVGEIAGRCFQAVLGQARAEGLLSDEHFTVDGTLIEAWASHKSFRPKDDQEPPTDAKGSNPTIDFKGTKRSNETHRSTTDSDARLYRKSANTGAQLGYLGHAPGCTKKARIFAASTAGSGMPCSLPETRTHCGGTAVASSLLRLLAATMPGIVIPAHFGASPGAGYVRGRGIKVGCTAKIAKSGHQVTVIVSVLRNLRSRACALRSQPRVLQSESSRSPSWAASRNGCIRSLPVPTR